MATILEKYNNLRAQVSAQIPQGTANDITVWTLGEVIYRIGVLETCQMFTKTAPRTMEIPPIYSHYGMFDAYVQSLAQDRRYGPNRGENTQKERDAAQLNLARVIEDYRNHFSSFAPSNPDSYQFEIERQTLTLLPAWIQFRQAFVPI